MIEKIKQRFRHQAWFILFLPFLFIANGYNDFFGHFPPRFVLVNLLTITCCTLLIYLLLLLFFKNRYQTALFSFYILVFMLIFGFLHDGLKQVLPKSFLVSYSFLIPLMTVAFIVAARLIKKSRKPVYSIFLYLNTLVLCFTIYELIRAAENLYQYKKGGNLIDASLRVSKQFPVVRNIPDSAKPDIYFLVFDGMPSTVAMKKEWNYNNNGLDSFLTKENFFVSTNSKSNYNLTVLSISSTLNMDYIPPIDPYQDETKMYFKAGASILNNSLTKVLQKHNYNILQLQPVSFGNKDWNGELFFGDMLYKNYFYKTLPGRVYRDLAWNISKIPLQPVRAWEMGQYEKRNTRAEKDLYYTIQSLKNCCSLQKSKPSFVYAHFLVPHDPYVFDSTGKRKPVHQTVALPEQDHPTAFLQQVQFANKIIRELVAYIKQYNRKNTVIIIEGDHGFRNLYGKKGYMIFDNLSCYYFPDHDYRQLYDYISPINSFRVVLNKYFDANLPLLQDSSIFIPYTLPGPGKK